MQTKKLKWTYLNKETKIFFLILFFLFLVSIIASEKDIDLTILFLGYFAGALIGFIYFYGVGRLEIHTEKKYDYEGENIWKKIAPALKVYFAILALSPLVTLIIKNDLFSYILFLGIFGAMFSYAYFYGTKKIEMCKEELDI